jgi:hypothetical protein
MVLANVVDIHMFLRVPVKSGCFVIFFFISSFLYRVQLSIITDNKALIKERRHCRISVTTTANKKTNRTKRK